jgi:hypothetical protein
MPLGRGTKNRLGTDFLLPRLPLITGMTFLASGRCFLSILRFSTADKLLDINDDLGVRFYTYAPLTLLYY